MKTFKQLLLWLLLLPLAVAAQVLPSPAFNAVSASSVTISGNPALSLPNPANSTPLAGIKMKQDYLLETGTFKAVDEAGIWAGQSYSYWTFSKEVTASTVTGSGAPATTLFAFANNNGSSSDVVAVLGDAVARTATGSVFGANFIARNAGGLNGAKLVGMEIDMEPAAGTTIAAGSAGLYINTYNIASSAPAFQVGSVGGGTWGNGIILDKISGAGIAFNSGATGATSGLDLSNHGAFGDAAIIVGNGSTHRLKLKGTASTHAGLYNDTSNNVRLVLGSGLFAIRNSSDTTSLFSFGSDGNLTLSSGGAIYANMRGVTLKGTAGTNASIYNDNSDNVRVVLGDGGFFFRNSSDTTSLASIDSAGNVKSLSGAVLSAATGIGYAPGAGGTVTQLTDKSTGVSVNKPSMQITTAASALLAGAKSSFTVANTSVAAVDVPVCAVASGGTANAYRVAVTAIAANSFNVTIENITAGSLSESPVINCTLIKGASS